MGSRRVGDLVRAARDDEAAFTELVEEFAPMVWAIARSFRLERQDAADVCQMVWLQLATHLHTIREPDMIAGWLKTTTRNECFSLLRARGRWVLVGLDGAERDEVSPPLDTRLVADERARAVWQAFASLPDRCQALLRLLLCDPPLGYDDIADLLDLPRGSIGPTRKRCLEKLARHPAISRIRDDGGGSPSTWGSRDE